MKVYFETFGCRLNRAEALDQEAQYLAKGWELAKTHREADLFIIRGCSVTARAQRDCEKIIDHLKRHYPLAQMRIEGCLPKSSATKKLPANSDIVTEPLSPTADAPIPTRTARAYLKVQDGCSGKCTFCIVPTFRGASTSIDYDAVLSRANRFIEAGYHEIVVTGCNLSLYASQGKRLPELITAIASLSPSTRVRIGSVEPGAYAEELVSAMAENDNICRFLHLPIQSGSNRILTAMKRGYLLKDVEKAIELAEKKMPLIALGCDMMTGFPGENEVDYMATKGFLKRYAFSKAHIFPYSERPGTFAAGLPGAIPRTIRKARARELADLATAMRSRFAKRFIGKNVEVLIESESQKTGWTGEYLPCKLTAITGGVQAKRREIVKVHVIDVRGDVLRGPAISE